MLSLQSDMAHEAAKEVVAMVAPLLRDEEQRELFIILYPSLMDMLRTYEVRADRRMRRLYPGKD